MPETGGASQSAVSGFAPGMKLREAIAQLTRLLVSAGIREAAGDARILAAYAAGCRPVDLIANPEMELSQTSAGRLAEMARRRSRSEPVSRILGERDFYGRTFEITPATLDPRADTETLVEATLELLSEAGLEDGAPLRIIDIGTGSGCLIVTLLAELPAATAVASDVSPAALAVALRNAERHGVANRLQLRLSDLLENVEGQYNVLVSNPPYIPSSQIAGLELDVVGYDPHAALDGGVDGLDFYRRIAAGLQGVLLPAPARSWALFEVGAGQARDVAAILEKSGFSSARSWVDLGGHTRCVATETRR